VEHISYSGQEGDSLSASERVPSIPFSLLVGIATSLLLNYATMAVKAYADKGGPMCWTVWFRPSHVDRKHRAIGIDMLFTGVGAELGFLAAYWLNDQQAATINPVLQGLNPRWQYSQSTVSWALLTLLLILILALSNVIRYKGYTPSGTLREDVGVSLPNATGRMAIIVVYLLGPFAAG
jgi:hypothetical protein